MKTDKSEKNIKAERTVYGMVTLLAVAMLSFLCYGVMMMGDVPASSEDIMPLDPEETVLFYRPAELEATTPLVESPCDFEDYNLQTQIA